MAEGKTAATPWFPPPSPPRHHERPGNARALPIALYPPPVARLLSLPPPNPDPTRTARLIRPPHALCPSSSVPHLSRPPPCSLLFAVSQFQHSGQPNPVAPRRAAVEAGPGRRRLAGRRAARPGTEGKAGPFVSSQTHTRHTPHTIVASPPKATYALSHGVPPESAGTKTPS